MNKENRIILFLIAILIIPYACLSSINPVSALTLSAPGNLKVEAYQYHNILTWTNNITEPYTYTMIERATDQGDFYPVTYLHKEINTYKDLSVSNGHVYRYRARTYTGATMSPYTQEVEAITLYPTDFRIANVHPKQVDLEWTYPALSLIRTPDYKILIERRPQSNSIWTLIATIPATETIYRDTSVSDTTNYYYRIKVQYGKDRYSDYIPYESGINTITAYPLTTPLWGYGMTDGRIRLKWDMSLSNGGSVFLERKLPTGEFITLTNSYTNNYIDIASMAGETYTYRLHMRSNNGIDSVYTDEITVTAEPVPVPADLTATAYDGEKIVLSWYYPYEDETGFEIWRKSEFGKWEPIAVVPKNTEIYSDFSSINGITYSYRVRAVRGDSSFSDFTPDSKIINMFPDSPGEVICYVNEGILFIYSKNTAPDNTAYTLEYRKDINSQWESLRTATNRVLIAHLGVSAYSEYYLRIRANIGGLETVGPELHFFGSAPDAPRSLQAQHIGYKRVSLVWEDTTEKEEGYNIYRSVRNADGTLKRTLIGSVGKDTENYIDSSPVEGGHVYYEVVAYNISGESGAAGLSVKIPIRTVYKDIAQYQWAHDSIYTLQGFGSFEDASNGYFNPQNVVTRGQLARMIIKSFNISYDNSGLLPPNDVTPIHIYYKDLMTAVKSGILHPDADGKIYPNRAVTRQEILLMLNGALGSKGLTLVSHDIQTLERFNDYSQIEPDELSIIASFVGEMIITGKSGQVLSLKTNTTRVEAAAFIYRTLTRYKLLK